MLTFLSNLVKSTLVPGSMSFLAIGVAFGVLLLYVPGGVAWGRRWLVLLLLAYGLLATPLVSRWLEARLHPVYPRIVIPADARGATAIVVLGNGAVSYGTRELAINALTRRTSVNVLEAARLYKLIGQPVVILSGGAGERLFRSEADLMADTIQGLGVPKNRLILERESRNTAEQAARVVPLLKAHEMFLLVTTPIHMQRAVELFAAEGRKAIPAPAEIEYSAPALSPVRQLMPNPAALRGSELVIYEYLAEAGGWLRKRLEPTTDTPQ